MDFYLVTVSNDVKGIIKPEILDHSGPIFKFSDFEDVSIGYFDPDQKEITDILTYPLLMVSQELLQLLLLYDDQIEGKAIQLFTKEKEPKGLLYYAINPKVVDCLYPYTKINPNGTIDNLILDKNSIPKTDIFLVDRLVEQKLIVSMRVAESLLRRQFYGIGLTKVEIE